MRVVQQASDKSLPQERHTCQNLPCLSINQALGYTKALLRTTRLEQRARFWPEGLRAKVMHEVRIPVLATGNSTQLEEMPDVVTRVSKSADTHVLRWRWKHQSSIDGGRLFWCVLLHMRKREIQWCTLISHFSWQKSKFPKHRSRESGKHGTESTSRLTACWELHPSTTRG